MDYFTACKKLIGTGLHHITPRQSCILLHATGNSVGDIAASLGLSKPAVTRAVDKLVECDLLSREQAKLDRRLVVLQPTRAGRKFLAELAA